MTYFYSPNTGEHIDTDTPADWMGVAPLAPPAYDKTTEGCFWRGDRWEIVPAPAQPPPSGPTPIEIIRAIEAPNDDDRKKFTRQFMLAVIFKEAKELAKANPSTAHFTDADVHAYLLAQDKGYAKLYLEEQAIIPWRELIP